MTEKAQNADFRRKAHIFADSPFSWKFKRSEGAENRRFSHRKPQIFAEEKPQETADWAPSPYKSVTFCSALKILPGSKRSKKSLRESLCGSLRGSWPTPHNESKMSLWSQKQVIFDSQSLLRGDSFWTLFGGSPREPGRILTPLPGGVDRKSPRDVAVTSAGLEIGWQPLRILHCSGLSDPTHLLWPLIRDKEYASPPWHFPFLEGLAGHLNASRHFLAAMFDSQLPCPKLSHKCLTNCLSPTRQGFFCRFQDLPTWRG